VRATAAIAAEDGGGVTRLSVLRSQAPLVLRRTADAVHIVTGAAGPVGGDVLRLRIDVGAGATLDVRTVAASVALPGLGGDESVLCINARVGPGGRLTFLPEPTVIAARARHRLEMRVSLAAGAAFTCRDEVILGRHGEVGGRYRARLHVDLADAPLLRHELALDPADGASLGPAVLAGHRAAGCLLVVEPAWATGAAPMPAGQYAPGVAVMPLAGPAVFVAALADGALTLRRRLDAHTPRPRPAPAAGEGVRH